MKYKRPLWLLILLLLFLTNCNKVLAISDQAQQIIENIRISLSKHQTQPIQSSVKQDVVLKDFKGYIPGLELEQALQKMRAKIYDVPQSYIEPLKPKHIFQTTSTGIAKVKLQKKRYIPGQSLAQQLIRVRQILGNGSKSAVRARRRIPNLMNLKKNLIIDRSGNTKKINDFISDSQVIPFANNGNQYRKIRSSKAQNKEKQTLKLRTARKVKTKIITKNKLPSKQLPNKEVERFNSSIKFHEFKMPKNYRIIVR